MENIINVTGGKGGNVFLVKGETKTALLDCGMAYCEAQLIKNIKHELAERPLDCIFISHSHYDHVGAIPYLKKEWPNSRVLGARHAKQILVRPNALKKIKDLGQQAARFYGANTLIEYDDQLMQIDDILNEGDVISLGNMNVRVIETTGHTQCSLSFLLDDKIMFASESTGYMSKSEKVYPAFITSCAEALASIDKCKKNETSFHYFTALWRGSAKRYV
ncbi:MBL fold metallo-hydrolase [Azotosporobacter soli]|uniref:MBL fold metallo-hydrolase n=1 Tax=Azotosporobacter soli TaxID=3055040 RepID=UPI0031FEA36A